MFGKKLPAAVLWDMDGTLVDSEPYWLLSEKNLAAEHSKEWTEQDGLDLVGMSLYDSSKIIKSKLASEMHPDEIMHNLTDSVVSHLQREIPWRPGALELLSELKKKGVKTALVTMSLRRMALAVADSVGFEAFDVVVAGDDVRNGKPHPEPYLKAAELLGVEPQDCIAFEDSITGLRSAETAGTIAVGVENIVPIPPAEGRIVWRTLAGVKVSDLRRLFK
ncbi:HAD family hydrolase [Candidatus Rhodoluna planktonica]|uniref:Hydrolase n=1 Tax=Candidatus Rhodoluna planktonica TaxID=535712 RepID=A0A1D9DZA5_9MICO|nr:HAD family phosphatase [Candidatus Rhodoluna planktonica]AOY56129.1 hydrolase [Candidatus Rhodoluna planktonica]